MKNAPPPPSKLKATQRFARLTIVEQRFVDEYVIDLNARSAALRSGVAEEVSLNLLAQPHIQNAIQKARASQLDGSQIFADEVLRRWWLLATSDAREIIQMRVVNCRYCWGFAHHYQYRDDREMEERRRAHMINQKRLAPHERLAFDDLGGTGFDGLADPCRGPVWVARGLPGEANSDHSCPRCDGMGERKIYLGDTRDYSIAAALLYNGVEITKNGSIKVNMRDRDEAMNKVATHLGMLVQRSAVMNLDPTKLTNEQLDEVLKHYPDFVEGDGAEAQKLPEIIDDR